MGFWKKVEHWASDKDFFDRKTPGTFNKIQAFQNKSFEEATSEVINARERLSYSRDYVAILQNEINDDQLEIDQLPNSIRYRMDSDLRRNRRNILQARIRNHKKQIKKVKLSEIQPLKYRIKFMKDTFKLQSAMNDL